MTTRETLIILSVFVVIFAVLGTGMYFGEKNSQANHAAWAKHCKHWVIGVDVCERDGLRCYRDHKGLWCEHVEVKP